MKITVSTRDRELGRALADGSTPRSAGETAEGFDIGPLQRVPGAVDSFWQLAVDIGAVSAPIGVACNLIASWLYDAYTRRRDKQTASEPTSGAVSVKLVIHTETKVLDLQLRIDDRAAIQTELERVLRDDDSQS
jgi:hypothetical protein